MDRDDKDRRGKQQGRSPRDDRQMYVVDGSGRPKQSASGREPLRRSEANRSEPRRPATDGRRPEQRTQRSAADGRPQTRRPEQGGHTAADRRASSSRRPADRGRSADDRYDGPPRRRRPHSDDPRRNGGRRPPEPPRRKTRSYPTTFLWVTIFVLFLVYLGGYAYQSLTRPNIPETRIENGSVELPTIYDGIIVRDEVVYRSNATGVVVYSLNDLDHVNTGGEICSIQDAATVSRLEAELKSISNSLIAKQETRTGLSVYGEEVQASNKQIKSTVDTLGARLAPSDIEKMYELADKVRQELDVRNRKLLSESRGSLRSLVQERNIYEALLSDAKQNMYAAQSGIVSYLTDGFEETLTIGGLSMLTKEKTSMKVDMSKLVYARDVEPDSVVCKIVQSNTWYIAAHVRSADTSSWAINSVQTLYIDIDGTLLPLEVRIDSMQKASDTETYVVFRCTRQIADFMAYRSLRFRLERGVMEGLKIPNTAIVDKTILKIPKACVMERDAGKKIVMKRLPTGEDVPVTLSIVSEDDNTCDVIQGITDLWFGDTLVNKSESGEDAGVTVLSEIDNVKGVYVTNAGATVFRRINLGGRTMSNATHTVLDPALNTQVNIHDKIIVDGKSVTDRQLVNQ